MNKAGLYSTSNSLQRRDATYVIDQYNQFLKWSDNDSDLTLDIGCGSGDVTVEVLLKLTNGFVIGTDISTEMVKYAKLAHKYPKLRFQQFDVVTKSIPSHFIGQFDHVVSFYCMHWIQDQRWRNFLIKNILNPPFRAVLHFAHGIFLIAVQYRIRPTQAKLSAALNL